MDQRCRESEGKAKIEGYMSVSDEEAHQHGIVDLLQVIRIVREMVGELELKLVSDLGPKLLWEAMGEGSALFCGGNTIFGDQKSGHSDELPVVLSQISE